jgi:hypothetical protein
MRNMVKRNRRRCISMIVHISQRRCKILIKLVKTLMMIIKTIDNTRNQQIK